MRIERARLHGIGVFETLDLEFPTGTDPTRADTYLFTGPNGCGKSSLLYALAAGVGGLRLGPAEPFVRRLAAPGAFVEVQSGAEVAAIARADLRAGDPLRTTWQSQLVRGLSLPARYHSGEAVRYAGNGPLGAWEEQAAGEPRGPFSFAAFAYAGGPVLAPFRVQAIQELTSSPLGGALGFTTTAHAGELAQWLANTHAKAAFAEVAKHSEDAERYRSAVQQIQRALSRVLGEEVAFEFAYEPLAVRVRQGGRTLDLELLAEGVKSVVSWLADLLMRLQRLPWVDDRPTNEREFLLLLDEVDIYLHPALQRRILPAIQELFPRAQIMASTHSPFVVASATDAWVYELTRDGATARLGSRVPLRGGMSYAAIVRSIFGIEEEFDAGTEEELAEFYELRQVVLGGRADQYSALVDRAASLARRGIEVADIVQRELRQVDRKLGRAPAA